MTREEIINEIKCLLSELNNGEDAVSYLTQNDVKWLNENIKALEQESRKSRDMKEIEEVINCDADAETKCKMISNILTAKPHYFVEPQESEDKE